MRHEVTPERRVEFGIKLTRRLAELFQPVREQIKSKDDLLFAVIHVLETVDLYWAQWQAHPDFALYAASPDYRFVTQNPLNPEAVAVYRHAPARDGLTRSYAIGGLSDLVSYQEYQYGKRRLGDLVQLMPIHPAMPTHPTRMISIDNSYSAGGAGYVARRKLKEHLPRELWPWITRLRQSARDQKYHFLAPWMRARWPNGEMSYRELFAEHKELVPVWYHELTKMELWYGRFREERPAELRALEHFISFEDLWRVCTNKVMPEDVPGLLKQQQLFQIERRNRSGLDRQPKSLKQVIARVLIEQKGLFDDA